MIYFKILILVIYNYDYLNIKVIFINIIKDQI